jgi:hypothetical protein
MQATVLDFDTDDLDGHIVFDDGRTMSFSREVFLASGLRLLRPGQRVRVELSGDDDIVVSLTIATLA